jgi:hypothetical protein
MSCTFEANCLKARPNVPPCCLQPKFSNVMYEATVWSLFSEQKTQKVSFWWHAFPINISFNAKEPIQIIFACIFPNSINLAIAYHLCWDTGNVTITQMDNI